MPIMYCITHGYMDSVYKDRDSVQWHNHEIEMISLDGYPQVHIVDCEGPFAECPPPDDLEQDWQDHLVVPPWEEYMTFYPVDFDIETDRLVLVEMI